MAGYFQPDNLAEALVWLAAENAVIAAGCSDLLAMTDAAKLTGPVLDITAIDGLNGIGQGPQGWRIGAATPWSAIRDADLPAGFHGLQQAAAQVGSVQIQNTATIGGNLCNASPAADGVVPLLTLDAEVELASGQGVRRIGLADFIRGPRQTVLQAGEILTAVILPEAAGQGSSGFFKLGARKYLVISIAMAAARVTVAQGRIETAALAIGACGPVAARLAGLETALVGVSVDQAQSLVTRQALGARIAPIEDIRADQGYRETAAVEAVARALQQALEAAV